MILFVLLFCDMQHTIFHGPTRVICGACDRFVHYFALWFMLVCYVAKMNSLILTCQSTEINMWSQECTGPLMVVVFCFFTFKIDTPIDGLC